MEAIGRSKVFISYSRRDLAFTEQLAAALGMSADFDVLFDRVGIGHGEDWKERLGRLIVECDTMVFVLSPDSVSSEICAWELQEARRRSKRIIPILWRAVNFASIPADLGAINAVPFDNEHAVSGLPKLLDALNSDLAWLREHTRLGERAFDWEQSGHATAYLLRGAALDAVREWLAAKPSNAPAATELQREFIRASEEDQSRLLSDERKRSDELAKAKAIAEAERDAAQTARSNEARAARRVVRTTTTGLVVALVLFMAASAAGWLAYQKGQEERLAAERAEQQRDAAQLIQSRFLSRAAREYLTRGDAANAIGLARAALPTVLSKPDRPFAVEPVQVIFDAYGKLRELATLRGHTAGLKGAIALTDERILTWGEDGTVRWWRTDGTLVKTTLAHKHPTEPGGREDTGVHGVLRLENGGLLTWGVDKTAKLWTRDGTFIQEFLNEASWIRMERLKDGRIAALIGNEYRIWSAGLKPLLLLRSPAQWIEGGALLSDGRFLTWQQGRDGKTKGPVYSATLWSPDGVPGPVLEGHERSIRGGFQLADRRIVTWENGASLRVWSADGKLETIIQKAHKHALNQAFAMRDGRIFTWGQEAFHDNVWWARIWTAQGKSVPLVEASDKPLQGLELADGRLLLGTDSLTPSIWHTDGTRGPVLRGHEKPAYAAAQWPDGRIATKGADHTARVWSRDGAPLLKLLGHEDGVTGVEPLSRKRILTWSYRDRTARIWSEEPGPRSLLRLAGGSAEHVQQLSSGAIALNTKARSIVLYGADLEPGPSLRNDARDVIGLTEMPDGRLLTLGSNNRNRQPGPALRMWSAAGEVIGDLGGLEDEFLHVALTPSGRVIGFDASGQVWVWRPDGQLENKHSGTEHAAIYRVFPLLGGRFVTVSENIQLQIWSAEGEPGGLLRKSEAMTSAPRQIVSFADGRLLTIPWNAPPQIWEANGEQGPSLSLGETPPAMTAVPLQNGQILLNGVTGFLAIVKSDGSFRVVHRKPRRGEPSQRREIFSLTDGRLLVSTPNHGTQIWSADGTPGKRLLDRAISGAKLLSDGNILVWPAGSNDLLHIIDSEGRPGPLLRGHESTIKQAFQLSDGRILSWAEDASVRIWPGSTAQAMAWADDVVSRVRPLTLTERCDHYLELPKACAAVEAR